MPNTQLTSSRMWWLPKSELRLNPRWNTQKRCVALGNTILTMKEGAPRSVKMVRRVVEREGSKSRMAVKVHSRAECDFSV